MITSQHKYTASRFSVPSLPALALLFIVLAWLLPGLLGHEPWKPDEAYTFGLIQHIVATGDWVIPTLAGEPFMEKPPLFFISAAISLQTLSPWLLSAPDAARLMAGLWMGLAFGGIALAARRLYGHSAAPWAIILLAGCLGLPVRAHQMITDTALFAGIAWGLAGLVWLRHRPLQGGLMLGLGGAVSFLAKGLLGSGYLGLTALLLFLHPAYRTRYTLQGFGLALLISLPLPVLWMLSVYERSPDLFWLWFKVNNFGRFDGSAGLGPPAKPFFYSKTLPWYALPVWPLALLALWLGWRKGDNVWHHAPAPCALFLVIITVLTQAANARELYTMPLLLPLTLLALPALADTQQTSSLNFTRIHAKCWHILCKAICTFCLLLAGLLLFATLTLYSSWLPSWIPNVLQHLFAIDWQPAWSGWPWFSFTLIALGVCLLWRCIPATQATGFVWRWCLTITLTWGGVNTLWMPALDHVMSYQATFQSLAPWFRQVKQRGECVSSVGLGEPQRALLDYYAHYRTQRLETYPNTHCRWLLVQTLHDVLPPAYQHLPIVRTFQRPNDTKERFWLFKRIDD